MVHDVCIHIYAVIYNPPRSTGRIFLDHQRLRFNDTHMTIAWRFENNGCCAAPVTYKIWKTTCGMSSLTLLDTTEDVDYTILSSVADESVYFLISAICTIECGRSFYFQVHSNG